MASILCTLLVALLHLTTLASSKGVVRSGADHTFFKGPLLSVSRTIKTSSVSVEEDTSASMSTESSEVDVTNPVKGSTCPDVCLDRGCVSAAAAVISRMNQTVDPCDDFFEFSCGNFIQNTVIPDEKSSVGSFSIVHDLLREKNRILIEKEVTSTDSNSTKMIKDLYNSCMNTTKVNELGLKPLTDILFKMGGWPVIEGPQWNTSNFDWIEAIYTNRKNGYSADYYLDFSISIDVKNSSNRIIWFDQASLGLSREYLVKGITDSDVQAYLKYSVDAAILLGAKPDVAKADMEKALQFHIELAKISLAREDRRNTTKLYNLYTLKNLTVIVPEIPWVEYVNTLLPPKVNVTENEIVGVSDISFLTNLTKIMAKTPKRTQANYLLWRVVAATATYLTEDIRDIQFEFSKALTGRATRAPRWKECLGIASGRLSYAAASLYVKGHFDDKSKTQANELVQYIRDEFWNVLTAADWMDNVTKQEAFKKAQAIKEHIGYPPELKNDTILDDFYKDMTVTRGPLLENMLGLSIFGTDYAFGKLREKIDKLDWKRHAAVAVVNAYYSSIENSIKFPAGILQNVFFEPDRPKYMNFGAIGFIIGHEITHGFDDQGKQFDADGNLRNWWDPSTQKKYSAKAKCIIEQYGNYTVPGVNLQLNGINTQGENIADNGGIKQAYHAYQKWVSEHKVEKGLPGLSDYSNEQLLWISSAQVWCGKYRQQSLKVRILTGVHSPGRYRVIGSFSNSNEFAKDWKCHVGSKMNPVKKCTVW